MLHLDLLPQREDGWTEGQGEALDSTFYYVLFTLSVLAAALGQFLVNHELQGERGGCWGRPRYIISGNMATAFAGNDIFGRHF